MKEAFERLWNGYLCDECVAIDTDSERLLMKKAADLHESVDALLNEEQMNALEKYRDGVCDVEALFVKKAFLKGCEFAFSFKHRRF